MLLYLCTLVKTAVPDPCFYQHNSIATILNSMLEPITLAASGKSRRTRVGCINFRSSVLNAASSYTFLLRSGILLILFSLFLGSGAGGAETNFWSLPWSFYVGTAFPCIVGMSLANVVARSFRLAPSEVVALSIECCYQNTAIATSVAVTMFPDPTERAEAVSVPLFYGVVEAVIIGVYCICAWKLGWTKAPSDEKVCSSCRSFHFVSLKE